MATYKIPLTIVVECDEEEIDELVHSIVYDIHEFGAVEAVYEDIVVEVC